MLTIVTTAARSSVGFGETSPPNPEELSPEELRVLLQGIVVVVVTLAVVAVVAFAVVVFVAAPPPVVAPGLAVDEATVTAGADELEVDDESDDAVDASAAALDGEWLLLEQPPKTSGVTAMPASTR